MQEQNYFSPALKNVLSVLDGSPILYRHNHVDNNINYHEHIKGYVEFPLNIILYIKASRVWSLASVTDWL